MEKQISSNALTKVQVLIMAIASQLASVLLTLTIAVLIVIASLVIAKIASNSALA